MQQNMAQSYPYDVVESQFKLYQALSGLLIRVHMICNFALFRQCQGGILARAPSKRGPPKGAH